MKNLKEIIEQKIAVLELELDKYKLMLSMENNGITRHPDNDVRVNKRGPKPGKRGPRGPYKPRKGKIKRASKAFLKKLESPDWNTEIPKILMGGSYTSREITEALCPGRHKKTMKVLHGRSSAYISNVLIPKGVVKPIAQTDGPTKYALA